MKVNSEQFKEIMCKTNRITPYAKLKFKGRTWVSSTEESESKDLSYNELNKIVISFGDDQDEQDVICVHLK